MFETTVITSANPAASRRRRRLLPVAVGLHVTAIGGALFASVWSVDLPTTPPNQVSALAWTPRVETPVEVTRRTPPPRRDPAPVRRNASTPLAPPQQQQQTPAAVPSTTPLVQPEPTPAVIGDSPEGPPQGDSGGLPTTGGDPNGSGTDGVGDGRGSDLGSPTPDVPLEVGGNVTAPVVLSRVQPIYPELLRRTGITGYAIVECIVGSDGRVAEVTLIGASHSGFGAPAVKAVEQWKFSVGRLNGRPVATRFRLTVNFTITRR